MTENEEKYIQSVREKITKFQNQEKTFIARIKEKEHKLRTRRLIQNGALAEKYLNCENIAPLEFEKVLKNIADTLNVIEKTD